MVDHSPSPAALPAINGVPLLNHANGTSVSISGDDHALAMEKKLEQFTPTPRGKVSMREERTSSSPPPALPHELAGMIPLSEVVSRLVQKAYEDLNNLVEILPAKSDVERKHAIREFGSQTRKQVVKTLVLARWARDAEMIQKCQDIRMFLQIQNGEFRRATERIGIVKQSLIPARSRQWDILTAIDALSTGSYLRLPKVIKQWFVPPPPVTPADAIATLRRMDRVLRHRLRMNEIIPIEMSRYRVANGRVYFTVPNLFSASFVTGGAERTQLWYLLNLEFLIGAKDPTRIFSRFPRSPEGAMQDQIISLVNQQLALGNDQAGAPEEPPPAAAVPAPSKKKTKVRLPPVDAPLVRAYNFLQMFALGYQLEILHYQALQLVKQLGWSEYLRIEFSRDRRTLTASYWMKNRPPPPAGNAPWPPSQAKIFGGTLTISLESRPSQGRSALQKALADLEDRTKAGQGANRDVLVRTRDKVEGMRLRVLWDPTRVWSGVAPLGLNGEEFDVDPSDLDFEAVVANVIVKHANALMNMFYRQLRQGMSSVVFRDDELRLVSGHTGVMEMHVNLRPGELTVISLDIRSGAFVSREKDVLPSLSRTERIALLVKQINLKPTTLADALCMTRFSIIMDDLEKKASVLRTTVTKTGLVRQQDMPAFGPQARLFLYIALASFPSHYLVLVLADSGLQYAMLKVTLLNEEINPEFQILECAWLDIRRITGADPTRDRRWTIDSEGLADLYAFCRARVAHAELEQQLRDVNIASWPTFDSPSAGASQIPTLPFASPLLQKEVPTIRIESSQFLGAMSSDKSTMSSDAWCAYIAFRAINWTKLYGTVGVIASVALRSEFFVPLADEKSTTGEYAGVRVKLDSKTGVINFHLESVHGAIVAFLRAWEGVSKAVSVAREVRTMSQEPSYSGVQLLSFTLSSVSLLYQNSFALTISSHGSTSLVFSYHGTPGRRNPHEEGVEHYSRVFEESGPRKLIEILRDTLPLLLEFDQLEKHPSLRMRWFLREAGWVRAFYGDARHALDFRLLPNSRILVVDGALPLFAPFGNLMFPGNPMSSQMRNSTQNLSGTYEAISGLPALLLDVTRAVAKDRGSSAATASSAKTKPPNVVPLDSALLCYQDAIRPVVRAVHEGMLKMLEAT